MSVQQQAEEGPFDVIPKPPQYRLQIITVHSTRQWEGVVPAWRGFDPKSHSRKTFHIVTSFDRFTREMNTKCGIQHIDASRWQRFQRLIVTVPEERLGLEGFQEASGYRSPRKFCKMCIRKVVRENQVPEKKMSAKQLLRKIDNEVVLLFLDAGVSNNRIDEIRLLLQELRKRLTEEDDKSRL